MLKVTEKTEQVSIKADTVEGFMTGARKKFHGSLGVTTYGTDYDPKYDKANTITSATVTMTLKTGTPKWVRGKTPDKATIDAIAKIIDLAVQHEQNHRDTYKDTFNKSDVDNAMIGKTDAQASKLLGDLKDKLDKACETLHSKEGKINVVATNGKFTVTMAAAGSGGCKP